MLSSSYEASPRLRSLPMSSSQPPGSVSGSSLAPGLPPAPISAPIPTGSVVVGSQVTAPPVMSAPGSGSMLKNGTGIQSMEEEVLRVAHSSLETLQNCVHNNVQIACKVKSSVCLGSSHCIVVPACGVVSPFLM